MQWTTTSRTTKKKRRNINMKVKKRCINKGLNMWMKKWESGGRNKSKKNEGMHFNCSLNRSGVNRFLGSFNSIVPQRSLTDPFDSQMYPSKYTFAMKCGFIPKLKKKKSIQCWSNLSHPFISITCSIKSQTYLFTSDFTHVSNRRIRHSVGAANFSMHTIPRQMAWNGVAFTGPCFWHCAPTHDLFYSVFCLRHLHVQRWQIRRRQDVPTDKVKIYLCSRQRLSVILHFFFNPWQERIFCSHEPSNFRGSSDGYNVAHRSLLASRSRALNVRLLNQVHIRQWIIHVPWSITETIISKLSAYSILLLR